MDPIAHTLVGASLAQTGLRRTTPYAAAALIAGANLPDIDAIATFGGSDFSLWWRRGWTHGVPALIVLPAVLTAILVLAGRARGKPVRPGVLLALSYFATWTHPTLDWMNNYGMRWLMPLDGRWFYGDTLFIVDPWIWTALGGALFLAGARRLPSYFLWGSFTLSAAFLLLTVVPGLVPAKVIWCAMILGIAVARALGVGRDERASRRFAIGALAAVTIYIAALVAVTTSLRARIADQLVARGESVEKIMVGPVPVTPFVRDVVVQTPSGYYRGRATLWPDYHLDLDAELVPRLDGSPIVQAATSSPSVRGFMNWARFPFAEVEETPSGYIVHLNDARYTATRIRGFGSAQVVLPKERFDTDPGR